MLFLATTSIRFDAALRLRDKLEMTLTSNSHQQRAEELHQEAMLLSDDGRDDEALAKYIEALELDEARSVTHYNVGLIYKYRNAWLESFEHNKRAVELQPDDEASNWNLAIAATALRDWKTARSVWNSLKMPIELGDTEIDENFGTTPVRLDPEGEAEVVWATRIDPVRARLINIPLPTSGFRYGDVVLHDGAAVGYRFDGQGNEKPVFNVFEIFSVSKLSTYEADLLTADASDIEALDNLCEKARVPFEDWTGSMRVLCRACSEGRAHEAHDHSVEETEWNVNRRVGFAATDQKTIEAILDEWANDRRHCEGLMLALEV